MRNRNELKKIIALLGAAALVVGSLAGCSSGTSASETASDTAEETSEEESADEETISEDDELESVTVILDYVANTNHTGLFVALEKGYYEDYGLDVEIVEPTEGTTETLIAVGKGDFGIAYQEDLTVALTSEDPLPLKAIATIIQHNTSGFVSSASKDITSPADFEGKTYAGWGGAGEEAVLNAVMTQYGADFSTLNMIISDGSGFEVLDGEVDIEWFYEGWDVINCRLNDFELNYMGLRELDDRLDYYTPIIIANTDTLENNPEMVKKFLAATELGYLDAIEDPESCAEILSAYASEYSIELLTESAVYLAGKYMEDTDVWGQMEDETWDNYTEFLVEYGVIDEAIDASDCYTNEFLPGYTES